MVRRILAFGCLLAASAWAADEASDRLAVERAVITFSAFTADYDGPYVLPSWDPKPAVIISREPMGEAQIVLPDAAPGALFGVTLRIFPKRVRFITPDVAIVDAAGKAAMLLVVKREGTDWKIASLRFLVQ